MPSLTTREILENQFNGLTPIKRQNPRYGEKDYYYINPNRDRYSSLSDEDIAYVDSPDDPNPFLQQQTSQNQSETLYSDNQDTTFNKCETQPRTVYQHLTGLKTDNTRWYDENPNKDKINFINDSNLYSSDRTYNDCLVSNRFNKFLTDAKEEEGNFYHISDQPTNRGISQNAYEGYQKLYGKEYYGYPQHVKDLTEQQVDNLYCQEIYKPTRAEAIDNEHLAQTIFDTAVNLSPEKSATMAQRAVNAVTSSKIGTKNGIGTESLLALNNLSPTQIFSVNNMMSRIREDYYNKNTISKWLNGVIDRARRRLIEPQDCSLYQ